MIIINKSKQIGDQAKPNIIMMLPNNKDEKRSIPAIFGDLSILQAVPTERKQGEGSRFAKLDIPDTQESGAVLSTDKVK